MKPSGHLVYLASPYSHDDKVIMESRISTLCKVDAVLCSQGTHTVSPLSKHFILQYANLPSDWAYWQTYSKVLLERCDQMIVIAMEGWDRSIGVLEEIEMCQQLNIPIKYLTLLDLCAMGIDVK